MFIILIILQAIFVELFAESNDLEQLKQTSPYCVDKVNRTNQGLSWSISNSCYLNKKVQLPKEEPKPEIIPEIKSEIKPVVRKDKVSPRRSRVLPLTLALSANKYVSNTSANSAALGLSYNKFFRHSWLFRPTIELENFFSIKSSNSKLNVNRPFLNYSFLLMNKKNKNSFGAELGRRHYLQEVDKSSLFQFSISYLYFVGGHFIRDLTERFKVGSGGFLLLSPSDIGPTGRELSLYTYYLLGTNLRYIVQPSVSFSSFEKFGFKSSNTKYSLSLKFDF